MTETRTEFWGKNLNTGDKWNAKYAEDEIHRLHKAAKIFEVGMPQTLAVALGFEGIEEIAKAATKEMQEFESNKQNDLGYHLNHAVSGRKVYSVFDNDIKEYVYDSTHDTKEKAEERASELGDANVQIMDDEGKKVYLVFVYDDDKTKDVRNAEAYGDFVCDCDTLDEAVEKAKEYDYAYIVENPSEEWWTIISHETGESPFKMMFPTPTRALAFLYKQIQPKAWMAYIEALDEKDTEKPASDDDLVLMKGGRFNE